MWVWVKVGGTNSCAPLEQRETHMGRQAEETWGETWGPPGQKQWESMRKNGGPHENEQVNEN